MKDFMYKCLNAKKKAVLNAKKKKNPGLLFNGCKLSTPPNIIIPPIEMPNGEYDFGVSIYNTIFNKQPKPLQQTYLTLFREDPLTKVKNYKMLEDAMNNLVEKYVGFDSRTI